MARLYFVAEFSFGSFQLIPLQRINRIWMEPEQTSADNPHQ
ncbi:hypothetical protein J2X77_003117 [Sphingobacterium sp. 2149]|nr:hypothetical protein [Sphingobacterium sp. 2149]